MSDDAGFDPNQPFRRAQGLRAGLTRRQLQGPTFRRLFHDVYVSSAIVATAIVRARGALLISPNGSRISHFTAAEIMGAFVPEQPDTHVSTRGTSGRRWGVRSHLLNPAAELAHVHGLPASSPTQVFLDLARFLPLVELVAVGDSLVKNRRTTPAALVSAAVAWRGHGARLARRVATFVRAGVDSPMESRLRMLIVLAGLPEPTVNHGLRSEVGDVVMRFDLSYPALKLAIEYDGRQHAESDRQWARDIKRREELDRGHWRLLVVRSPDVYATPSDTLARIVVTMRELGSNTAKIRSTEWERHFPRRA